MFLILQELTSQFSTQLLQNNVIMGVDDFALEGNVHQLLPGLLRPDGIG